MVIQPDTYIIFLITILVDIQAEQAKRPTKMMMG